MMQGLYIGATGLKTHGEGMQIVSNNLANVSTVAYKQQLMLFQDMMYQSLSLGSSMEIVNSGKGLGVAMNDVRSLNTEGAFEPGSAMTDLAISGKGYFQVTDARGETFYTRAGNFRFDEGGILRNPTSHAVTGIRMIDGVATGGLTEIDINFNDEEIAADPPKATGVIKAIMNVNVTDDVISDPDNPYFSMISAWDGKQDPPMAATNYSQPLTLYDAEGKKQELTIHFDAAPSASGQKRIEYLITLPPEMDSANADTASAGMVMAGTLTFNPAGELIDMSAFTPSGDPKELSNWTPAQLVNGVPAMTVALKNQEPQVVTFDVGVSGGGWNSQVSSAADVGTEMGILPGMSNPVYASSRSTSWPTSSALSDYTQDGYPKGDLNDLYVDENGIIVAQYSNGETHELYQIPLFRFTSEDGLRREGNNLYSATRESGGMSYGMADTENYGAIQGSTLETSNVDMAKEMTTMIVVQRGFQSNSKSITTLDTMIQRAIELKRN